LRRTQDRRIWFGEEPGFGVSRGKGTRLLNIEVPYHERCLLALAHGHEELVTWREVKGVAKNLSPFSGFDNSKDKEPRHFAFKTLKLETPKQERSVV
jgi:hypothetical protein